MRISATGTQLGLVLGLALAVRIAAGLWWQSRLAQPFGFPDSESYWHLAMQILAGETYQYGGAKVFRTPGYPLLLAAWSFPWGTAAPLWWLRLSSALLGTLAVGGVYLLARQLADHRTAMFAATGGALLPETVAQGVFILSEAAFAPLLLLQLALSIQSWQAEQTRRQTGFALAAGATAGLAALVRPSWLLFVPALSVLAVAAVRSRQAIRCSAAMLLALVAVMAPWWIRNAVVTGHFVPTTLQVGASLYDGLHPQADGGSDMSFVPEFRRELASELAAADEPLSPAEVEQVAREEGASFEYALDRRMWRAAIDWAAEHPVRVLELAGIKLVRMWNLWPNEPSFRSWPLRLAVAVTYVPLAVLAIVGAVRFRQRGLSVALLWLPAVYFTLLHVIFVSSIRYRQPALFPALVLAAMVLAADRPRREED